MNLSIRQQRIEDISKELQNEELKELIYNKIQQFVYKYQSRYYKQYKGEIDDLVVDFFADFVVPKKHRNGEVYSEMDRFEADKLGGNEWTGTEEKKLATYIQNFVTHRLIDRSRTDKREINYAEKYDEETGELSLDFLVNKAASGKDEQIEEIEFTDEQVLELRDKYDEMSEKDKIKFLKNYAEVKDILSPNFKELFEDLVGDDLEKLQKKEKKEDDFLQNIEKDCKEIAPEEIKSVQYHKVTSGEAVRIVLNSNLSEETQGKLDDYFSEHGWKFYTQRKNNLYYLPQ